MTPTTSSRLIIVCGLPGAGKTTLARELEASLAAIRMCPDEWMDALHINLWDSAKRADIEALQWQLAQQLLACGLVVIIEFGSWAREERDVLRLGARVLGAAVELRYLTASVDDLFDRIRRRDMEQPPIERDALARWAEKFDVPTPEELALFDASPEQAR